MSSTKFAADLFCGAGGTTSGLLSAARELNLTIDLLAINHWNIAIDTHTQNHPGVRHLCESLDNVDPRKAVPGGKLDLLCASPECTHHSNARGGRPCSDQSRATAWHICRWAEALRPESILIENVREFRSWGPLSKRGKPLKKFRGKTYAAFLNALESLGYRVTDAIINCADYGDPTTRQRLFIMASLGAKPVFPVPTHAGRWRPARDIIDWTIKGQSIYERKRPLSPNTLRRIAAGLKKFGGEAFLVKYHGDHPGRDESARRVYSPDQPLATVDCSNRIGLAQPFIIQTCHSGERQPHSVGSPLPTITSAHRGEMALVEPFLVHLRGTKADQINNSAKSIDQPVPALTTSGAHVALCEPFVMSAGGPEVGAIPVTQPLNTVLTRDHMALVEPFIVKYYGKGENAKPVTEPLPAVTTNDRFALVEPNQSHARLDIRFRMLQPHELAAAMGFPRDYKFSGTRGCQVKQIGNAVPVQTAAALCKSLLS